LRRVGRSYIEMLTAFFAVPGNDMTMQLWEPAAGARVGVLEGHTDWVRAVVLNPCGTLLASGSEDDVVRVRDPAAGVLRLLAGHSSGGNAVTFSPAGCWRRSDEMAVRLWR
jgi:WD40 repeat protein